MQMEGIYHKLWNKQLKHHEKMKREAENKQHLAATTATSVAASDGVNGANVFKEEGEEDAESSMSMAVNDDRTTSPNKPQSESVIFAEEEGADDDDDERLTTTAHESSNEEGEEDEEENDEG
jgi:hypothetical protein